MRIFLSYAWEDRAAADDIRLALANAGHTVWFDRESLPQGEEFHVRIRRGIERAQLVIFLVTPRTLDAGSYTLNEMAIAEKTWPAPGDRILPVLLEHVSTKELPPYVRAVTFLETTGNVPAAVTDAVYRIERERRRTRLRKSAPLAALCAAAALVAAWYLASRDTPATRVGTDGAPAVLVAAGKFAMGDDESWPVHDVYVDAFYMDQVEITTGRYAQFLAGTGSANTPDYWEQAAGHDDLPVVGVTWNEANAYCRWAGRRLPTEAEWEKAARGADSRPFPWGDAPPALERANYENSSPGPYDGALSPVGTHALGRSPYGVDDLAGNASEWVSDWYSESFSADDAYNPRGPNDGAAKVIRGGGRYDPAFRLSAAARQYANPDTHADDIGFRCASDP